MVRWCSELVDERPRDKYWMAYWSGDVFEISKDAIDLDYERISQLIILALTGLSLFTSAM
jgi:hypothetical protein